MHGLEDLRMSQVSSRRAPVGEVLDVQRLYRACFADRNVKHFHAWYGRQHNGTRSYSWVKNVLQEDEKLAALAVRERERKAAEAEKERLAKQQRAQQAQGAQGGGCVYKPVMSDDDIAACRR